MACRNSWTPRFPVLPSRSPLLHSIYPDAWAAPCHAIPASQPLLQEANEARRHEAGIAARLLDRIVEPIVRRALHDTGAHEEVGLLQSQQECVGLRAPVDEIVLGAHAQEDADVIVGKR